MNRKADLSLSISAIVVIVIAFVVLGLGLSLTRTIFKGAEQKLPEAFAVTQLEAQPTSNNPITISQTVEIDRQKSKTMQIGFYNKGEGTAVAATFGIVSCLQKGSVVVENSKVPSITSPSESVGPSSSLGYSIIVSENGLAADTYICTIGVKCGAAECPAWANEIYGEKYYETKQFFLRVIA